MERWLCGQLRDGLFLCDYLGHITRVLSVIHQLPTPTVPMARTPTFHNGEVRMRHIPYTFQLIHLSSIPSIGNGMKKSQTSGS